MTPTVAVISMGGTISCASGDETADALVPTTDPAANLTVDGVLIRSTLWSLTDSSEITFNELHQLAHEITTQVESGVDGVVVTQGTDTLEETAYALSLLRPTDRPVVFTAAMRAPTVTGSDAAANLGAAITVAMHSELPRAAAGAVVVMNDAIHSARWVQKGHTQRLDAFSSGEVGLLGVITEGLPVFLRHDPAPVIPRLLDTDIVGDTSIALITAALDQDTRLIDHLVQLGYHGVVVDGFGGGHVSGAAAEALGKLADDIPVVFASRARAGAVLTHTYGSPGAELDLLRRRCIPSGLLTAIKARVLLTLLIRSNYPRERAEALITEEGLGAARLLEPTSALEEARD